MKGGHFTILILLLFSHAVQGQSLTGLWTGAMSNDSTTVRKDQSFEIALTQYKNKVYGFSRSTFIVNDTLYYIVKRVKGEIDGDVCEVEDDKVVSHNFPRKPEKGVKVITTFRRNPVDSTWSMDGEWKTNKTKKYYSISGSVSLKEETNYEQSKIFPHLEELGIAKEVKFYVEAKEAPTALAANRNTIITAPERRELPSTEKPQVNVKTDEVEQKRREVTASNTRKLEQELVAEQERKRQEEEEQKEIERQRAIAANNPPKKQENPPANTNRITEKKKVEEKKPTEAVAIKDTTIAKKAEVIVQATPEQPKAPTIENTQLVRNTLEEIKEAPKQPELVQKVAERKLATAQVFTYKSDSLMLALYDNGEVDGDTVSVLLNGEILMARQGLKASAIRKTIYIPEGTDSLTLVLYAENLGKYPPNTGLLVVYDGDDVYQIRFSADFTQNAAVVFRRKND